MPQPEPGLDPSSPNTSLHFDHTHSPLVPNKSNKAGLNVNLARRPAEPPHPSTPHLQLASSAAQKQGTEDPITSSATKARSRSLKSLFHISKPLTTPKEPGPLFDSLQQSLTLPRQSRPGTPHLHKLTPSFSGSFNLMETVSETSPLPNNHLPPPPPLSGLPAFLGPPPKSLEARKTTDKVAEVLNRSLSSKRLPSMNCRVSPGDVASPLPLSQASAGTLLTAASDPISLPSHPVEEERLPMRSLSRSMSLSFARHGDLPAMTVRPSAEFNSSNTLRSSMPNMKLPSFRELDYDTPQLTTPETVTATTTGMPPGSKPPTDLSLSHELPSSEPLVLPLPRAASVPILPGHAKQTGNPSTSALPLPPAKPPLPATAKPSGSSSSIRSKRYSSTAAVLSSAAASLALQTPTSAPSTSLPAVALTSPTQPLSLSKDPSLILPAVSTSPDNLRASPPSAPRSLSPRRRSVALAASPSTASGRTNAERVSWPPDPSSNTGASNLDALLNSGPSSLQLPPASPIVASALASALSQEQTDAEVQPLTFVRALSSPQLSLLGVEHTTTTVTPVPKDAKPIHVRPALKDHTPSPPEEHAPVHGRKTLPKISGEAATLSSTQAHSKPVNMEVTSFPKMPVKVPGSDKPGANQPSQASRKLVAV